MRKFSLTRITVKIQQLPRFDWKLASNIGCLERHPISYIYKHLKMTPLRLVWVYIPPYIPSSFFFFFLSAQAFAYLLRDRTPTATFLCRGMNHSALQSWDTFLKVQNLKQFLVCRWWNCFSVSFCLDIMTNYNNMDPKRSAFH